MFSFGSRKASQAVGAVIDIGSGSVGAAIVVRDDSPGGGSIVWSHREFILLRKASTLNEAEQGIRTAFTNVCLELGNAGLRALHAHNPSLQIDSMQVSIAAPWQYTATKQISFADKTSFIVDDKLIADLTKRAQEHVKQEATESPLLQEFGIEIIGQSSIAARANGYAVKNILGKRVNEFAFTHITMLADSALVTTVREIHEKLLPKAELSMTTLIVMAYHVVVGEFPNTLEAVIVDITKEATEVGIVRDGAISFVSHIPVGSFTIARALADALQIPTEEAYTYLKTHTDYGIASIPERHRTIVEEVFRTYNEQLVTLFGTTGDNLSVPHSIFVHSDLHTELFFGDALKTAAEKITGSEHSIHPITSALITESHDGDSAVLLGTRYWLSRNLA